MPNPKPVSRLGRTIRVLILISLLGVGLALYNSFSIRRDIAIAAGPESPTQKQFFIDGADRPDIAVFYKNMTPAQRQTTARNIARYRDPKLPQLIAKLLADFDAPSRKLLTESLTVIAKDFPKETAIELKNNGSFQQLGVSAALRGLGPSAIPVVVQQLTVGDARNNAANFLVSQGKPAIPALLEQLKTDNADVRRASAEALGKIGDPSALPALVDLFQNGKVDERASYLFAISSIGDASSEALLTRALRDPAVPEPQRAQAALGLGRIGSRTAVATLWNLADSLDRDLAASIIASLQTTGDAALSVPGVDPGKRLQVAGGVKSAMADSILRAGLTDPSLARVAATLAVDRPGLVDDLARLAQSSAANGRGDVADAAVKALASTAPGLSRLDRLKDEPDLRGLILRREG